MAVPLRLTLCGLPAALSVTAKLAVLVPPAVGLKLTLTAQLAPAARLGPHVVASVKSLLFIPVMAILLMVSVLVPAFRRLNVFAALVVPTVCRLKDREEGDSDAEGATPVPLNPTICGLPAALSFTLTEAVLDPAAVGVKVRLIVQVPLAARVLGLIGQVLVWAKSPLFVPVIPILLMVRAVLPLFVNVTP